MMAKKSKKPKEESVEAIQKELDKFYATPEGLAQLLRLDLACIVWRRLLELGWAMDDVERLAKVKNGTVWDMAYARGNPNVGTIAKVGHAMGLNIGLKPGARVR